MTIHSVALTGLAAAILIAPAAGYSQQAALPAQDRPLRADGAPAFAVSAGEPVDAAFDASENLYVLDRRARAVAVYDRTGRPLRQVAGTGSLSAPVALAVTTGGAVVVLDVERGLVVFGADGRVSGTFPVAGLDPHHTRGVLYAHPERGVVVGARPAGADETPRGHPLRTSTALAWNRLDGTPSRELRIARAQAAAAPAQMQSGGVRMTTLIRAVFSPDVRWAVLPDGRIAVAESEEYRVTLAGPTGQPRVFTRPLRPRAVSAADRERFQASRAPAAGAGRPAPPGSMTMTGSAPFASVMPVIQRLAADPAGRLWIQRAGSVWGQHGRIDVVRADGTYLGTLPAGPMPVAFSRGGLAAYIDGARVRVQRLPAALPAQR